MDQTLRAGLTGAVSGGTLTLIGITIGGIVGTVIGGIAAAKVEAVKTAWSAKTDLLSSIPGFNKEKNSQFGNLRKKYNRLEDELISMREDDNMSWHDIRQTDTYNEYVKIEQELMFSGEMNKDGTFKTYKEHDI